MSNPAETYESYMVPPLFGPWALRLVQFAKPQPNQRVLDVACGTGIVARTVATELGPNVSIVALDLNPDMLAVARDIGEKEDLAIEWCEGRAEQLPFTDQSFDLVLSQFGLMFFADPSAALAEIHRVLAPSGRVAFSVWQSIERHPFYRTLDDVIQKRLNMSRLNDIFGLWDPDTLRKLLEAARFRDVQIESSSMTARFPNPEAFLAGEIDVDTAAIPSMQKLDTEARKAITEAIQDDMQGPLREATEGDHVVLPFHAHLVRALRS